MTTREKNVFFDINKLPAEKGLMIFPISMSRANTGQTPKQLIEYIFHFSPNKITAPNVGINFIYGDFLYMWSNEKASKLKAKYMEVVWNHKNALQKIIYGHRKDFQIQEAFDYMTWNQFYITSKEFVFYFQQLKLIYKKDKLFQKYVREDARVFKKKLNQNTINFFLEEHTLMYLMNKMKIEFPNVYIRGLQEWILLCYPGNPPKALIYVMQKNFFKLPKVQIYEGQYNLETKKYIDYANVDLETYAVK